MAEPQASPDLRSLRVAFAASIKDADIILVEDRNHGDGRYYTFLESQLPSMQKEKLRHICVETSHESSVLYQQFKKTGKLSELDALGVYQGKFSERRRAMRNLILAAEDSAIAIHGSDVSVGQRDEKYLSASKTLSEMEEKYPELLKGHAPVGMSKEEIRQYNRYMELTLRQRDDDNQAIAGNVLKIMKEHPGEKVMVIIGQLHLTDAKDSLATLLKAAPEMKGKRMMQVGLTEGLDKALDPAFGKLDMFPQYYEMLAKQEQIMAMDSSLGQKLSATYRAPDVLIGVPEEERLIADMRALDGVPDKQKARDAELAMNRVVFALRYELTPSLSEQGERMMKKTSQITERGENNAKPANVVEAFLAEQESIASVCKECRIGDAGIDPKTVVRVERSDYSYLGNDSKLVSYTFYDKDKNKVSVFKKNTYAEGGKDSVVKNELAHFDVKGRLISYHAQREVLATGTVTTDVVKQLQNAGELKVGDAVVEKGQPAIEIHTIKRVKDTPDEVLRRSYFIKDLMKKPLSDFTPISMLGENQKRFAVVDVTAPAAGAILPRLPEGKTQGRV